jgi:Spy/CpxP family protein refolding chaperone
MKLAEDKFNRAKGSMNDQSFKNARMRAEQAELDARLAEAQVLTLKSEEQLNVLNTRITRLRKQLGDAQ